VGRPQGREPGADGERWATSIGTVARGWLLPADAGDGPAATPPAATPMATAAATAPRFDGALLRLGLLVIALFMVEEQVAGPPSLGNDGTSARASFGTARRSLWWALPLRATRIARRLWWHRVGR